MKRIQTAYTFRTDRIERPLRFAVCSDLHSDTFDDVLDEFSRCDAVLIPGDLVDRHRRNNENALRFLKTVPEIVPVFYSVGNHERKFRQREAYMQKVAESKAILLDNESMDFHGVRIGGLSSSWDKVPDMAFLDRYETESGYRLLLCHHPEMYRDYVRGRDVDRPGPGIVPETDPRATRRGKDADFPGNDQRRETEGSADQQPLRTDYHQP